MKNFNPAMTKFNTMYERCSTIKECTLDEIEAVKKYGENLLKLYSEMDTFGEVQSKLRALEMTINCKKLK